MRCNRVKKRENFGQKIEQVMRNNQQQTTTPFLVEIDQKREEISEILLFSVC